MRDGNAGFIRILAVVFAQRDACLSLTNIIIVIASVVVSTNVDQLHCAPQLCCCWALFSCTSVYYLTALLSYAVSALCSWLLHGIFVDWVRGKFSSWLSLFILVFYSTHPSLTSSIIISSTSPAYLCAASRSFVGSFFAPSSHFELLTCTPHSLSRPEYSLFQLCTHRSQINSITKLNCAEFVKWFGLGLHLATPGQRRLSPGLVY